jgi:hypothetical protein
MLETNTFITNNFTDFDIRYTKVLIDNLQRIYVIFDFYNNLKCYNIFIKFWVPVFNYYNKTSDTLISKTQICIRAV